MGALTIKDIARLCGVSISTVSRAINNDPAINAKTRDRVLEVVQEFNYIPNNSARNLKMIESNTVALVVKGVNNPFFQSMFPYFQKGLEEKGYQFLFHTVEGDADEVRAAEEIAMEKRLKGLIFLGGILDYPEVTLENIRIPLVLCSVAGLSRDKSDGVGVSSVSIDDEKEAYKVIDYLCRKGHRRIAIIPGQKRNYTVGKMRLRGYLRALEDNGITPDENLIAYQDDQIEEFTEANGYATMNRLLQSGEEFTAVFVISDRMAIGAYRAINQAGRKIPDDISVVGFDGIELSRYMTPSLTTVVQPAKEMVRSSIQVLMEQIAGSREKKRLTYEAELHERESVRDISGSGRVNEDM